jgi:DNA-binding NarL/FixJ family response regulator
VAKLNVSRPYALFPELGAARHVFASATDAGRAFSMGASGVLPKDGAPLSLVRWLRYVMSGQLLVPLAVRNAQRSRMRGKPEELVIALTGRERQIMELC